MTVENENINNILALHFSGEKLTDEQEQCLTEWVVEHKKEYAQLSGLFLSGSHSINGNFDLIQAWNSVDEKLSKSKEHRLSPSFYRLVYAACITLVLGAGIFFMDKKDDDQHIFSNMNRTFMTVVLPDSSTVMLYPQAKISYSTDSRNRERITELAGKAFFKVKHDSYRSFTVKSNKTKVRVLGTSFLVDGSDSRETGIYVRDGVVKVSTKDEALVLTAEEQAFSDGKNIVKSAIEDADSVFSEYMRHKKYVNTFLMEVISDLEKEFGIQITVSDSIENDRITTQLDFVNIEEILSEISYICNIKYRQLSNKKYEFYKP